MLKELSHVALADRNSAKRKRKLQDTSDEEEEANISPPTRKVILALDIGSSSIRCMAYELKNIEVGASGSGRSRDLRLIPGTTASKSIRAVQPNTGKIHLKDSNGIFLLDAIDAYVDATLKSLRRLGDDSNPFEIVGIGISSFVMNLLAVDERGECLGPEASISYACNAPEVAKECQNLREDLGKKRLDELYQLTGAPIHSAYALAQLRSFYDNPSNRDIISRVHKWRTLSSVILSRWTGRANLPVSFSEASWSGLLNIQNCKYEQKALSLLPKDCRKALPKLADFADLDLSILEKTKQKDPNPYWEKWPELRSALLFLGIGDGACANIGSKCSTPSRIAVTVGTSAAARICLPHKAGSSAHITVPKGLFCYRIDRSHILVGGALTDGGSVVEWVSQLLNLSTSELFLNCVQNAQKLVNMDIRTKHTYSGKTQPLIMAPFLSGERSTGYRDGATGAIMGITRETTPAHLMKSCVEGVTLRISAILNLILQAQKELSSRATFQCIPSVVASGKALEQNAMWRQMIADSSGLKVVLDQDTSEGTSRGVGCLVAAALDMYDKECSALSLSEEEITKCKTSEPRQKAKEFYGKLSEAQEEFIEAISPLCGE